MRRFRSSKRPAFTLVEILVVVAIIAILAAILFPAFSRARDNARRATCGSNQKQLALACLMYAGDYDGRHISYFPGSDRKILLYPYIKQGKNNADSASLDVWNCPDNTLAANTTPVQPAASYGFNTLMNGVSQAAIQTPAETVMCADAGLNDDGTGRTATHLMPPSQATNSSLCRPSARHFGGVVVAWMDGHVKWMKMGRPFYPLNVADGLGNGVITPDNSANPNDPNQPNYRNQLWDLN